VIFFINPAFGDLVVGGGVLLRTLLPFLCFGVGLWYLYKQQKTFYTLGPLFFLIGVLVIINLFSSYYLSVSLFKLLLLFVGASGIISCFQTAKKTKIYWLKWFFTLYLTFLILSVPTFLVPSIGYFRNGSGFQGLSNQPQAFGIFIAPFASYAICHFLFNNSKYFWGGIMALSLGFVFASGSRTSFITVILSVFLALLIKGFIGRFLRRIFSLKFFIYGLVLLLLILSQLSTIKEGVRSFVLKRDQKLDVSESFEASRGFLILTQLKNISENPLLGIGFQLSSIPKELIVKTDPFFGLPIQAPVEKGNILTAILEENGIIGTAVFIIFFVILILRIGRHNSIELVGMTLASILTNIGEATLFSFGGMGLFVWLIIGLGYYKYL
jgi:O-antigen ligase